MCSLSFQIFKRSLVLETQDFLLEIALSTQERIQVAIARPHTASLPIVNSPLTLQGCLKFWLWFFIPIAHSPFPLTSSPECLFLSFPVITSNRAGLGIWGEYLLPNLGGWTQDPPQTADSRPGSFFWKVVVWLGMAHTYTFQVQHTVETNTALSQVALP